MGATTLKQVGTIASVLLQLDRSSDAFLQRQICDGLRQAISAGVLGGGARLPSTRALAAELAVSRTTIVAALTQLVSEGYLTTRERSGTFVARRTEESQPAARPSSSPGADSPLRLSERATEQARDGRKLRSRSAIPRAFRMAQPALDNFPVREWSRILSRRAARVSFAQLDYSDESPELRAAIAELVSASRGTHVHGDQVLLFNGSQGALEFAAGAILNPGDRVWMEDPGYLGARNVFRAAGASIAYVPVDDEGLVVEAGKAIANDARLVFTTPSCQFPLGVALSEARRQQLLRWADQTNACVVEDDYHSEFRFSGAPLPALYALDASHRVLYVSSFSWTMFPALRLGYLIAPAALVDRLRGARAALWEALPSLMQLALADFIAEGHFVRHLRKMKLLYRERRDALMNAAGAWGPDKIHIRPVQAGLHAVADLPSGANATAVSAAAKKRGVEAVPLSVFHANTAAIDSSLVLGFGAVDATRAGDAMEQLVSAIDEVQRSGSR